MMTTKKTFALVALVGLLAPSLALGASLRLEQRGNEVRVVVDAQGESLNAFEGSIEVLSADVGEVLLGESIVPLWTVRPSAEKLSFAGIVPGGYDGSRGQLFSFMLQGNPGSQASVRPSGVSMLINDGSGTAAEVSAPPISVTLGQPSAGPRDVEIPEFSEVVVARDDSLFGGAWFVAFNAQDSQTGVARFEVAEQRPTMRPDLESLTWREATSPHLLEDQSRESTIFVKAIDGAGNEAIASIAPESAASPYGIALLGAALLLAIAIAAALVVRSRRRA
jgi:hypothetical protein